MAYQGDEKKLSPTIELVSEDLANPSYLTPEWVNSFLRKVADVHQALITHQASEMPHLIKDQDSGKIYRYGFGLKNGITQLIYEEVK